jgi:uncharacterized protein YwbE
MRTSLENLKIVDKIPICAALLANIVQGPKVDVYKNQQTNSKLTKDVATFLDIIVHQKPKYTHCIRTSLVDSKFRTTRPTCAGLPVLFV